METSFLATIRRGDTALVSQVTVLLEEAVRPTGSRAWRGVLHVPLETSIPPGMYVLDLDDGRSGIIQVLETPVSNSPVRRVAFEGTGPLGTGNRARLAG